MRVAKRCLSLNLVPIRYEPGMRLLRLATLLAGSRGIWQELDAARATDLREAVATLRALLAAGRLRLSEPDIEALMLPRNLNLI